MTEAEIVLLLLAVVAGLTVLAPRLAIPYPIVMTIGGLALSFIDLRDRGVIGEEALRRVERDLDLEELRAEG